MTTTSIVLTKPRKSGKPSGLNTSMVNGQPMLTLADDNRGAKELSVAEQIFTFTRNQLGNQEWLRTGHTTDSTSGVVMDFDGTFCYATAHCEDAKTAEMQIRLFVNDDDVGVIGTINSGINSTFVDTSIDFDFNQGDKIRLFAVNVASPNTTTIEDTVVKITAKWRS